MLIIGTNRISNTQCFTKLLAAPHCQGFVCSAKQSIFVVYYFVPNEIKRTEK